MKKPEPPKQGPITKALFDAIDLRKSFIDGGMSEHEANRRVGQGLKAILGNPRPEGWKFYCANCHDTGWVNVEPGTAERERLMALYGSETQHQGYVMKCEPCKWTEMEREKRRKQLGQDFSGGDDDLALAGQTKSKRGFSKFGR